MEITARQPKISSWRVPALLIEPGAALPDGFPSKDKLELAGYVADADLFGADECELTRATGISTSQATAVLTALAGL
jgi:hypothetical protein